MGGGKKYGQTCSITSDLIRIDSCINLFSQTIFNSDISKKILQSSTDKESIINFNDVPLNNGDNTDNLNNALRFKPNSIGISIHSDFISEAAAC